MLSGCSITNDKQELQRGEVRYLVVKLVGRQVAFAMLEGESVCAGVFLYVCVSQCNKYYKFQCTIQQIEHTTKQSFDNFS